MSTLNFTQWRVNVSQRMKMAQIMEAFQGYPPETPKYVCAPCSNCKGALRDGLESYGLKRRHNVQYGGLAELIVNAMVDLPKPFFDWLPAGGQVG
jgi:Fe-S oxidoreductase